MSLGAINFTEVGAYGVECDIPEQFRKQLKVDFKISPVNFSPLPPPISVKLGFISACSLILLFGLIANILVIIWITRGKLKRTSTDIYIVSLAITDLMTVVTILPLQIALLTVDSNWNLLPESHAQSLCKASAYFHTAFICISLLTLVIIAIDRYIAICHPVTHYKIRDSRHTISAVCTVFIWALGLLASIEDAVEVRLSLSLDAGYYYSDFGYETNSYFLSDEITYVPDVAYYKQHHELIPGVYYLNETCHDLNIYRMCMPKTQLRTKTKVTDTALFVLMYVVPQLIMAFCYISISHRLWLRKPVGDNTKVTSHMSAVQRSMKKTTVIMMVMVLAFGLLWLPYWCKKMYERHTARKVEDKAVEFDVVDLSFNILTYTCIISSPIIYLFMDRAFQKRVALSLRSLVECIKPGLPTGNGHLSSHITSSKVHTVANTNALTTTEHPTQNPTDLQRQHLPNKTEKV